MSQLRVAPKTHHSIFKQHGLDAELPANVAESIARKLDGNGKMSAGELQAAERALIQAMNGRGDLDAASVLFQNVAGASSPLIRALQGAPLELALLFDKLQERGIGSVDGQRARLLDSGTQSVDGKTRSYEALAYAARDDGKPEQLRLSARYTRAERRLVVDVPSAQARTVQDVLDRIADRLGLPAPRSTPAKDGSSIRFTLERVGTTTTGVG